MQLLRTRLNICKYPFPSSKLTSPKDEVFFTHPSSGIDEGLASSDHDSKLEGSKPNSSANKSSQDGKRTKQGDQTQRS